jgi:hypothetical protein
VKATVLVSKKVVLGKLITRKGKPIQQIRTTTRLALKTKDVTRVTRTRVKPFFKFKTIRTKEGFFTRPIQVKGFTRRFDVSPKIVDIKGPGRIFIRRAGVERGLRLQIKETVDPTKFKFTRGEGVTGLERVTKVRGLSFMEPVRVEIGGRLKVTGVRPQFPFGRFPRGATQLDLSRQFLLGVDVRFGGLPSPKGLLVKRPSVQPRPILSITTPDVKGIGLIRPPKIRERERDVFVERPDVADGLDVAGRLSVKQLPDFDTVIKPISVTDQVQKQKPKIEPILDIGLKPTTGRGTAIDIGQLPDTGLGEGFLFTPIQKQVPVTRPVPDIKPVVVTTPDITGFPLVPPPRKKERKRKKPTKPFEAFDALVKVGPDFRRVNRKPLTKGDARSLGARVTDNTVAAQFKVKKVKSKKEPVGIGDNYFERNRPKFRKFQRTKGVKRPLVDRFIERRANRIDTVGEVRGLSVARFLKQRRGGLVGF